MDLCYNHPKIRFIKVPSFQINTIKGLFKSLLIVPYILVKLLWAMSKVDHIHLRCPGNMGLLGCVVQMLFPWKKKTAKYAGNWDWQSKQPGTYRIQQRLLRNTVLTHNMQALVYGEWPDKTKNILPFFTATYHENEKKDIKKRIFQGPLRLLFVGALSPGKRPLLTVKIAHSLIKNGHDVLLEFCGDGAEREVLEAYISEHKLEEQVKVLGNISAAVVKEKLMEAHFLVFLSKSEGWPKVVAEAMFWGCVPVTTRVSCLAYMLGEGKRGSLLEPTQESGVETIEKYLSDNKLYHEHAQNALLWSRDYTLEKFEEEIKRLL